MRLTVRCLCLAALLAPAASAAQVEEHWYKWTGRQGDTGCFHVLRKQTANASAPILLVHEFEARVDGKRLSLTLTTACRADRYLTPVRIISEAGRGPERSRVFATIVWKKTRTGAVGRLCTTVQGEEKTMVLPQGTVMMFALFEVVRALPFEKGAELKFHSLDATGLKLMRDHVVRYAGPETLRIGDREVKTHRFQHTGPQVQPAQYWVTERRRLIRVLIDGAKEYLLTTRAIARATLD